MDTRNVAISSRKTGRRRGYVQFSPRNLDRYPRLDTVLMVEKEIYDSRGGRTITRIWRGLPRKVLWTTFTTILDYLEYSNKIAYDKGGKIGWIFSPNIYNKYIKRKDLKRQ